MSTIGVSDNTFQLHSAEGKYRAQQQSYSVLFQQNEAGETRRKLGINSQGAFQNTRRLSEEANVERGNLVYSTMNNAVTVPEVIRISDGTRAVDSSATVAQPQPLPINTSENVESVNPASRPRNNSTENTEKMPERPQDLINKVSFGVAKVNFKSSAQYRKSYAFKIWREKGCFPFRLEDRPSCEDQKKSKRYLNAVKAQRDRNNEDAWRAYKSSKAKKAVPVTQRPSEGVEEGNTRSEGHHQTPFTASKDAVKKTKGNPVHNNNIPCYFKAKKDVSPPKGQVTPVTIAIPTSVIHVNTTKSCKNYQQITQVRQGSAHTSKEFHNQQFAKDNTTFATAGGQVATRKERSSASEESTRILPNTLVHWSSGETVSRVSSKTLAQPPQIDVDSIAPTRTSINGHSDETRSCIKSSAEVERLHGTQDHEECLSEKVSSKNHRHSTDKAGQFTHQHAKSDHLNVNDDGDRGISGEKELESQPETLQKSAPDAAQETNGHHLPTNNSNMVAIIKSTLNKKYCKENVKPGPERRKRRRENATTEVGEPQRGRSAKQSKATVFTRLDETVATNLADGIHSVNSEYFPIATLANKAAKETSEKIVRSEATKMSIKGKVEEIDRARLLLKELFDVTTESDGDHEMKTFDAASRSFGRKNILNHLSLLDRYFAEFQNKLSTPATVPSTDSQLI